MLSPLEGLLEAMSSGVGMDPAKQQAMERIKQIQQLQSQYPGRGPTGTGLTGLGKSDAKGWSQMLNERSELLGLQNALGGKAQPSIEVGRGMGTTARPRVTEPHDAFMARYGR